MPLKGKNILVTGGTGFIGSHLVEKLIEQKANIIVPYQDIDPKSFFFNRNLDKKTTLVQADLKDYKRILDIVTKYEIEAIFHLGAQAIVTTAYHNPVETFETNIMGTVNVLEAARLYGKVKAIMVASSDKAYGKIKRAIESKPLSGDHPYEVSKAAADFIAKTYFKTYGLPIVTTRFGNVYGEGDLNFNRIIPGIMQSLIKNEVLEIRSDSKYIRDYVYVDDIADAAILLVNKINLTKGEAYNVSSLQNLTVLAVIKAFSNLLNTKVRYKILNNAVNEIPVQSINFNKITKQFGWKPKNNFSRTAESIHNWYCEYFTI